MDHDVVIVAVQVGDVVDHCLLLVGGLRVLLAKIPVQGKVVAKPRHQLPAVELSLDTQVTTVEAFGNVAGLLTLDVVIVLGFLHLEVQVHSTRRAVIEHDAPLVQLATVVVKFVIAIDKRPNIVPVSARVVG